jgi:hypothetical protein
MNQIREDMRASMKFYANEARIEMEADEAKRAIPKPAEQNAREARIYIRKACDANHVPTSHPDFNKWVEEEIARREKEQA